MKTWLLLLATSLTVCLCLAAADDSLYDQNQKLRDQNRQLQAANEEPAKGFVSLFNGKDLTGWVYGTLNKKDTKRGKGYQVAPDKEIVYCTLEDGGNLFTEKEYGDFELRFEFKLTANANNGMGIRAPLEGRAAYLGMEIQIIDDGGDKYKDIRPAQHHGSIYDVVPAKQGALKPVGEWNEETIIARGRRVTVIVNGQTTVDANLDDVKDPEVLKKHPGLQNAKGHLGFLGHGARVEFRNLWVKEL